MKGRILFTHTPLCQQHYWSSLKPKALLQTLMTTLRGKQILKRATLVTLFQVWLKKKRQGKKLTKPVSIDFKLHSPFLSSHILLNFFYEYILEFWILFSIGTLEKTTLQSCRNRRKINICSLLRLPLLREMKAFPVQYSHCDSLIWEFVMHLDREISVRYSCMHKSVCFLLIHYFFYKITVTSTEVHSVYLCMMVKRRFLNCFLYFIYTFYWI